MTNRRRETLTALLFASPWIIGFLVFMLYPLGASFYYSFCDYSVLRKPVFIGFENYGDLVHDEVFRQSLANTLIYAVVAIPLGLIVAVSLALLLNSKVKGMPIYRTVFFIPSLVPQISLAMLWLWLFNSEHGVINEFIRHIDAIPQFLGDHVPFAPLAALFHSMVVKPPNWLNDVQWSKPAMVVITIWGVGNAVVIYLAGLQDVPQPLYEAADLDGAGWWAKTRHVTFPMLSPVILFNLIMGIIGTLQVFAVPYVLFPNGQPARSAYFYTMYLFDNAFTYHKMGYACAMAWIMFIIILVLTTLAIRLSQRHVHYGGS